MPWAGPGPAPQQGTQPTRLTATQRPHPLTALSTPERAGPPPDKAWAPDCCTAFGTALTLAAWAHVNPRTHPTSLVWPTLPTSPSSDSLCLSPAHTRALPLTHMYMYAHARTHPQTGILCPTHVHVLHTHPHMIAFPCIYMYMHTNGIFCPKHTFTCTVGTK